VLMGTVGNGVSVVGKGDCPLDSKVYCIHDLLYTKE